MKTILIILSVAILIIFLFQLIIAMFTNKAEAQEYTVLFKNKGFEIRFYPSATIATIYSSAKTYKELSGPGFRRLADYIFGGNDSGIKISMTSPVHMDISDSVSAMSFVMPSAYNKENLPKPNDPNVFIKKTTDEYIAAIRFGGFASDEDLKNYSEKLKNILKGKGIDAYGHYRFLGYNPPFQFLGRRNEIIVSIDWKEK
jgi:hypothetical protein